MCAPLEGGSGRGLTKLLEVVRCIWRSEKVEESWEAQTSSKVGRSQQSEYLARHHFAGRDREVVLLGALKSHDVAHASDWARSAVRTHAGQEYC